MLNLLAQGNINPDGSNQFVLQGKIVELTHMNYIERRKFIETLIGLEKYDQMKENTFKELEKAVKEIRKEIVQRFSGENIPVENTIEALSYRKKITFTEFRVKLLKKISE